MNRTANCIALSLSALAASWPAAMAQNAATATASAAAAPITDKPKGWETSVGLTLGLVGGNSENFNVGGNFLTKREWEKSQIQIGADGTYGDSTTKTVVDGKLVELDQTNVNNYGAFMQYNYLLTDRWYVGARGEGRHDSIAGVDYRIAATVNAGYYIIKKTDMFLTAEAGPGYIWQQLQGIGYERYATIRFAENFEWKFAEKTRLFESLEYLPRVSDWGNYLLNGVVGIETDIAKGLALQFVFKDFFNSQPAYYVGTDPIVYREKNDYQLLAGIIYRFQ